MSVARVNVKRVVFARSVHAIAEYGLDDAPLIAALRRFERIWSTLSEDQQDRLVRAANDLSTACYARRLGRP